MPVGQKVRCTVKVAEVQEIPGGAQTTMVMTLEREGGEKPVCVAETLVRAYQ
jgi:acyl dehydratase